MRTIGARITRAALLAPLALLVLALPACGGGGGPLDMDDVFGSAADNTADTLTQSYSFSTEITSGTQSFTTAGEGSFDVEADQGQATNTLTFPNGEAEVEQISNEGAAMLRAPLLFGEVLPEGVEWLRIPADEQTSLRPAIALTPGDLLAIMRLASTEVEEVGTEEIDGEEVTHYRAEVDPAKVEADPYQSKIDAVYEPLEIWVDEDGVVRRMKIDFTALYDPEGEQRVRTVTTTDFSDFGTEVSVTIPPETAIVDSTDVAEG